MKKVNINTNLIGKEEAFRVIALCTSTQLPLLVIGTKGTAKTATVTDFAKSIDEKNTSFIIELNEGTKVPQLLGMPDIKKLMVDKEWQMLRPITSAKTVIINEVDKANSGIRNAMLSIMAEKKIFDGGEQVDCQWETFVATANEIPKGEETTPFFDRFVVKYNMPGINSNEILAFMKDRSYKKVLELNMPTLEEVHAEPIDYDNIKIMLELISNQKDLDMSNRSRTKLDILVKAAKIIWEVSEVDAVVKIAELVAPQIVPGLEQKLLPKELSAFNTSYDNFKDDTSFAIKKQIIKELDAIIIKMEGNRKISPAQVTLCKNKYATLKDKFNASLPVMQ